MDESRYSAVMRNTSATLTDDEIAAGWHFCSEWDGLLVGPGRPEMESCTCFRRADVP